uniref:Uncharacterized protein n=1 Tax=Carcinus maenas virus 1 TaxID=2704945 RepID=A0A6G9HDC6_9VIRU|nr:hypothetical protein [Carcinus maenas virus 1]
MTITTTTAIADAKMDTLIQQLAKNNVWGSFDLTKVMYDQSSHLLDVNVLQLQKLYSVEPTKGNKKGQYYLLLGDYLSKLNPKQLVEFRNMDGIVSFIDTLSGSNKYVALYIKDDKFKPAEGDYTNGNIIAHVYSEQDKVQKKLNHMYHIDNDMNTCINGLVENVEKDKTLNILLFNNTVSLKNILGTDHIKQLQVAVKSMVINQLLVGHLLSLYLVKNC